jgi:hypothetical protein
MKLKYITILIFGGFVLAACASAIKTNTVEPLSQSENFASPDLSTDTSSHETQKVVNDAATGSELLPPEPAPGFAERIFSTDFDKHTVPYAEILSGGITKDGIPAIDAPKFVTITEADEWLQPEEPLIAVVVNDIAKAYPIQILIWHEIVNDTVSSLPLTITFCPLCNTGIAFYREFDGKVLDFGTTGRLRYSNLIMYDRQTETWWQQATGEGIAGEYAGRNLTFLPASMISWEQFRETYPDGLVLSRDTGFNRSYGNNPYTGYDNINSSPFLFRGPDTPDELSAMARVLTVESSDKTVAYPYDLLQDIYVINDTIGDLNVVVFWEDGTASALDNQIIAAGKDVGSANAFDRKLNDQILTFIWDDGKFFDEQTGSEWNSLGKAIAGSLSGSELKPVVSINHFWFSWAAFKPETRVFGR